MQVSTGAMLECTFGEAPAVFSASSENVIATTPAGVVTDVEPENIPAFGMCQAPSNPEVIAAFGSPVPCTPVLTPWTPGAAGVTVNGIAALDDTSECMCAWAGVITVSDPGQTRVTTE
ncbi:MAG TPA: DUF4280 domain-containing protein [Trebonia sp.]|nr:DUF4280 domain-containing protein [Trebonia sp.]